MHFDGSAIDGFSRVQESDVLARPDPNTFELLPWGRRRRRLGPHVLRHPEPRRHARSRATPARCSSATSTRPASRASRSASPPRWSSSTSPTATRRSRPQPLDTRLATSTSPPPTSPATCASARIQMLEAMGIPVEYSFHEDAPSQHEIDLRYTDALSMADNVMTFRLVVREIALEHGVYATFMPKPLAGVQGSGMHTHMSLFEGDTNAFHDPGDPYGLSKVGRGLHRRPAAPRPRDHRRHQPAGELVQAAHRRLRGARLRHLGPQQPLGARAGAGRPRPASSRRPASSTGRPTRPATRTSPSRCMLAAGLKGIEEGYELPPEASANVFELTAEERAAEGIRSLPAVAVRGARRDGGVRARGRGARRAHLRVVPPQQARRVGRLQDPGHPVRARPLPARTW